WNETAYLRFLDPGGYPCQQPPWGELSAVDMATGDIAWRVPLGNFDELESQGLKNTGTPNVGGSVATAGGLVFIAATTDSKFRGFDSRTGRELWMTRLDATGDTVPMTYQGASGKQYVLIAAGGTNRFRMIAGTADQAGDALIAFALPDGNETRNRPGNAGTPVAAAPRAAPGRRLSAAELNAPGPPLVEGEGKEAVVRMCTKCHGSGVFTKMRLSRGGWEDEVASMIEKGASGSDQDIRTVVEYLEKHFGREAAR
ncbi:MAG TPA: PQQ-binding-like beta-propeller repeat protein, partial [Gemmatimonadales bacterium]|nr:PQQ-binding-like beta-propeller repeat protein [Gemmatimonadales bacterium]